MQWSNLIPVQVDIIECLKYFKCEGKSLVAPSTEEVQFTRAQWQKLKGFIEKYPCKWIQSRQAFECPFDTSQLFPRVIDSGFAPNPNPFAYHPTPSKEVEMCLDMADFDFEFAEGKRFLDPGAGGGAFLEGVKRRSPGMVLEACEIDQINQLTLKHKGFAIVGDDFLSFTTEDRYNFIGMNPPFTINKRSVWLDHVRHAKSLLDGHGVLIAIVPEEPFFSSTNKDFIEFREECYSQPGFMLQKIEAGVFKSAPGIRTLAIRLVGDLEASRTANFGDYGDWFECQIRLAIENDGDLYNEIQKMESPVASDCVCALTKKIVTGLQYVSVYIPESKMPLVRSIIEEHLLQNSKEVEKTIQFDSFGQVLMVI